MPTATMPPRPPEDTARKVTIREHQRTLRSMPPAPPAGGLPRYDTGGQTGNKWAQLTQQIAAQEFKDNPAMQQTFYRLIQQESGFADDVVSGRRKSSAGALGIGQFMPATAQGMGIDPLNPEQALHGAAQYIKSNIAQFGGDVAKGIAAYNAGSGNVQKAVTAGGANWQKYLPGETQSYLQIIKPSGTVSGQADTAPAAATTGTPAVPAPGAKPASNVDANGYRAGADPAVVKLVTDAIARVGEINTALAKPGLSPNDSFALNGELTAQVGIIDKLRPYVMPGPAEKETATQTKAGTGLLGAQANAANANADQSRASTQSILAGIDTSHMTTEQAGAALRANFIKQNADILNLAFGNDLGAAKYGLDVIVAKFDQSYKAWMTGIDQGKLNLDGAATMISAAAQAQTAQSTAGLLGLNQAKYLSDEKWKNLQAQLPPGQKTQFGFAADSPMNQELAKMGVKPLIVGATPIPEGFNDPVANLHTAMSVQRSEGYDPRTAFAPALGAATDTYNANKGIAPFTPPAGTAPATPTVPDYSGDLSAMAELRKQWDGQGTPPAAAPTPPTGSLPLVGNDEQNADAPPPDAPATAPLMGGDLEAVDAQARAASKPVAPPAQQAVQSTATAATGISNAVHTTFTGGYEVGPDGVMRLRQNRGDAGLTR